MKKLFGAILGVMLIATLFSVMCITASAESGITVYVGETRTLPVGPSNDYDSAICEYTKSDPTLASIIRRYDYDYDPEYGKKYEILFLKPGILSVDLNWYLYNGYSPRPLKGSESVTYNIKNIAKNVVIKDLEAPYHGSSLDKEATVAEGLQIESIRYTMFNKEFDSFSTGDKIAIVVRVKCDGTAIESIDPKSRAYWYAEDVYSDVTNVLVGGVFEYVFYYTVPKGNAPCVKNNIDFDLYAPKQGDDFPKEVGIWTPGIKVTSVAWQTDDKYVDASKEYTVRIYFDCQDEYVFDDNFEENAIVTINRETVELKKEQKNKYVNYYVETTIKPYDVITTAHFNITVPKDGEAFPTEVTHPLSQGIKIRSVEWSPDDEVADASKKYTVKISFEKEDNYTYADGFADQAVVSVNGKRTNLEYVWKRWRGTAIEYYYTEATIQPTELPQTQTAHFNIAVPKEGEALSTEVTHPLSPGIDVKSVTWSPADEKADVNKEYTLTITFNKARGYEWADGFDDQNVVTINGEYAKLHKKLVASKNLRTYNYYIEKTMKPIAASTDDETDSSIKRAVETAHFNIAVPKEGEALSTEVTHPLSPGIDVKSVKWSPADEKADVNKEYTLTITFNKARGYEWADGFDDQNVVTINGEYAELHKKLANKNLRTYNYYIEKTIKPTAAVKDNESGKTDETGNTDETDKGNGSGSGNTIGGGGSKEPTISESYVFPFKDVTSDQWYYESVKAAHKMGLINGENATTYAPLKNMTFAEAIKLATCMNILYNGGNPNTDIANGPELWYSTYMKYALDNGIIDEDLSARANENITRKEYVNIFSKALPAKAFAAKNDIPSGSIPDIKEEKTAQDKAIYLLYRAGILTGNDAKGTFNPSANIKRSEVATILIRMMDPTARVNAPAELGK